MNVEISVDLLRREIEVHFDEYSVLPDKEDFDPSPKVKGITELPKDILKILNSKWEQQDLNE